MMKYRTQDDDSSRVIHTVLRITLSVTFQTDVIVE